MSFEIQFLALHLLRATMDKNKPSFPISLFLEACIGFTCEVKASRRRQGSHRWLMQNICCLSPWGIFAKSQHCTCKAALASGMHVENHSHAHFI